MKHLILTLLLFVAATSLFAQTAKVDTILTEKWNGTAFEDSSRIIYTYDVNCHLTNLLFQVWNTGTSVWDNFLQTNYTYVSGDYVSEAISQQWNSTSSSWDNATRTTYTYDGSFKILTLTLDIWLTNNWQTSSIATYSYNSNGYVDSILTQTAIIILQNSSLITYTYNSDNTPNVVLSQLWNGVSWLNASRTTYAYNSDKTVNNSITEVWQTSVWVNSSKITYTYNGSAKVLTETTATWDTGTSAWVNSQLTTYTYNGSGNPATALHQTWDTGTSTWVNESRDTYTYSTSCTLPLKLISFTATKNKNVVTLNWQTAEEINTSHFNIQRSTNGTNFSNVGNITAKGSGGQSYGFADNIDNLKADKVYYRLQMIDKDGKYSFSKIIPLTLDLFAGNIKTYPNPVKDQLYILFNAQNASKATLRITDAAGKAVHTETVSPSINAINVNVSRLGKGIYYIQLITDKGIQRTQFMKQ